MTQTSPRAIADFVQIPLAIASFLFFKLVKLVMCGFVALINRLRRGKSKSWRVVSAEMIGKSLALPVFMTKAPRWNPHAMIGMAGPLEVKSTLAVNTEQARESAAIWGFSVQPSGGGKEERISSHDGGDAQWKTLQLPAGYYMLVMRYYGTGKQVSLPAIQVDGHDFIETTSIDPDINHFYTELRQRRTWFYGWLNYYVYTLLRFSDWLSKAFVRDEFLPAGDPGMMYEYGAVAQGTALRITAQAELLSHYAIYFTRYDRASFPDYSQEIRSMDNMIGPAEENGYFLIRAVLKPGCTELPVSELLMVANADGPTETCLATRADS